MAVLLCCTTDAHVRNPYIIDAFEGPNLISLGIAPAGGAAGAPRRGRRDGGAGGRGGGARAADRLHCGPDRERAATTRHDRGLNN